MKLFIANSSKQSVGGGWSFIANLKKALPGLVTDDYEQAEVYFIASPSMVQRDEVLEAKRNGKKIVLRIDNAVRNSRNRNTGMSRMKDFALWADLVIFQSRWAREYLEPFVNVSSMIIHNSVDETIFYQGTNPLNHHYLYSRYSRDETKGWEMARYYFSQIALREPEAKLTIIGQFSPELVEGNFDFYMDEKFTFMGVQPAQVVAEQLRLTNYLIAPYFNDACSNTIIEALLCGCELYEEPMLKTGGTPEIISAFKNQGPEYFHLGRMGAQYKDVIEKLA